jgi:NH3-dependent NAD+ synthetase
MPVLDTNKLIENRVKAIRRAHKAAGIGKAELDLSGGIDSAVMACLLVEALGPENVILVHSGMSTNPEQTARAQGLAEGLGCPMINIDLSGIYQDFLHEALDRIRATYGDGIYNVTLDRAATDKTILGSIRSTLRAPVGRAFNRLLGGGLRHGTGNECEDRFLRFYQKGGDGEVDSNPIAMLTKGEVYQLAYGLMDLWPGYNWVALVKGDVPKVLKATIEATPSPDLWGDGVAHSDEAELLSWTGAPFTYSRIDVETGEYNYVGTIERMSRYLDLPLVSLDPQGPTAGDHLFGEAEPDWDLLLGVEGDNEKFLFNGAFSPERKTGISFNQNILILLRATRKAERITRHKENPNIPSYGDRESLIGAGILTNDLPQL